MESSPRNPLTDNLSAANLAAETPRTEADVRASLDIIAAQLNQLHESQASSNRVIRSLQDQPIPRATSNSEPLLRIARIEELLGTLGARRPQRSSPLPGSPHHLHSTSSSPAPSDETNQFQLNGDGADHPIEQKTTLGLRNLTQLLDEVMLSAPIVPLPDVRFPPPLVLFDYQPPSRTDIRSPSPSPQSYPQIPRDTRADYPPPPADYVRRVRPRACHDIPNIPHHRSKPTTHGEARRYPTAPGVRFADHDVASESGVDHERAIQELRLRRLSKVDRRYAGENTTRRKQQPVQSTFQTTLQPPGRQTRVILKADEPQHPIDRQRSPSQPRIPTPAQLNQPQETTRQPFLGDQPQISESSFQRTPHPIPQRNPVIVQFPRITDQMVEILQDARAAQITTINEQRETLRYAQSLNSWLEHERQGRRDQLAAISASLTQLAEESLSQVRHVPPNLKQQSHIPIPHCIFSEEYTVT